MNLYFCCRYEGRGLPHNISGNVLSSTIMKVLKLVGFWEVITELSNEPGNPGFACLVN